MNVLIHGSKGKMGTVLIESLDHHYPDIIIVSAIDIANADRLTDMIRLTKVDVAFDFSSHVATAKFATICATSQVPMVIGTTGHTEQERSEIQRCSERVPIVMASNFSIGVNVLFLITRMVGHMLSDSFDIEIIEMHHRHKKDAPSGTAHTLAKIVAECRGKRLDDVVRNGRAGIVGPRTKEEIGVHSIRGGDVFGEHTVMFAADGERVELTHKASSREAFARGAIMAARWVVTQSPGLYSMQDVLGLSTRSVQ